MFRNTPVLSIFLVLFLRIMAAGQDADQPIAKATPTPPARSTLRARVFYEDTGRPVRRTSVSLISKTESGDVGGLTDGQGNLEIHDLKAGKYYPMINAPGVVSPIAFVDLSRPKSDSIDEQLASFTPIIIDGVSDVFIELPARRGGAVSGRITYSNGDPAIGVRVDVLRKVGDDFMPTIANFSVLAAGLSGGVGSFKTDDRGVYRFAALPAGEYLIKVSEQVVNATNRKGRDYENPFTSLLSGSDSMLTVFFDNTLEKNKAQLVAVEYGQERSEVNIIIPDRELHNLGGKLVAAKDKLPIRNAKITISRQDDENGPRLAGERPQSDQTSLTGNDGEWKFVELPAGSYKLTVEAESSEFDESARAYGTGSGPDAMSAAADRAVEAAMARASNSTAGSGSARLPQKPPARKFAKKVQEFTVGEKDLENQSIELTYGGRIAGTISAETGEFPYGMTIALDNERSRLSTTTYVDSYDYENDVRVKRTKQDFAIDGVAAGPTSISVRLYGESEYYVKSAVFGAVDLLKEPIDIKDNDEIRNVQIVLSKETGILKGVILDMQKQPLAGITLTLVPTTASRIGNRSFYKQLTSNENGEFELKLPPFEYAAVTLPSRFVLKSREDRLKWLNESIKNAPTFKVDAGKTTEATIKHEPVKPAK